jgi:hypothetical protein
LITTDQFMLYITDNLLAKASEVIEKYNLDVAVNKKIYTVADTALSYRQVHILDNDRLLDDRRKDNQGWRKFSFKELVYIEIIIELKKFGIKHEQLKQLWLSFFGKIDKSNTPSLTPNKADSEVVIACVFGGSEMSLCLDSDGNILYFDPQYSIKFNQSSKPLIRVSLNQIVNRLTKLIANKELSVANSLQQLVFSGKISLNSDKENELLKIIRDKSYTTIKVKKLNGEIAVVYTEKCNSEGEIGLRKLEELIKAKDFQDVQLTKRDGKIVNYKIEETFKL